MIIVDNAISWCVQSCTYVCMYMYVYNYNVYDGTQFQISIITKIYIDIELQCQLKDSKLTTVTLLIFKENVV